MQDYLWFVAQPNGAYDIRYLFVLLVGAAVLLWVDWSGPAHVSEKNAQELVDGWNGHSPNLSLELVRIDVSEQSSEFFDAVADWMASSRVCDAKSLLNSGTGPLLWVLHGQIVDCCLNPGKTTMSDLAAIMTKVFGAAPDEDSA